MSSAPYTEEIERLERKMYAQAKELHALNTHIHDKERLIRELLHKTFPTHTENSQTLQGTTQSGSTHIGQEDIKTQDMSSLEQERDHALKQLLHMSEQLSHIEFESDELRGHITALKKTVHTQEEQLQSAQEALSSMETELKHKVKKQSTPRHKRKSARSKHSASKKTSEHMPGQDFQPIQRLRDEDASMKPLIESERRLSKEVEVLRAQLEASEKLRLTHQSQPETLIQNQDISPQLSDTEERTVRQSARQLARLNEQIAQLTQQADAKDAMLTRLQLEIDTSERHRQNDDTKYTELLAENTRLREALVEASERMNSTQALSEQVSQPAASSYIRDTSPSYDTRAQDGSHNTHQALVYTQLKDETILSLTTLKSTLSHLRHTLDRLSL